MRLINCWVLTVGLLGVTFAATAQSWTAGLYSFYPFDGNANDTVGQNNGTPRNVLPTLDRYGEAGMAYWFNGSNSAVDLLPIVLNNLASGTMSAWIKLDRNTEEPIFAKELDGANSFGVFSVGIYSGANGGNYYGDPGRLYFHSQNGENIASSSTLITSGEWHQVAATFTTTNCYLYLDGQVVGYSAGNFSIPDDNYSTTTSIGSWEIDLVNGVYFTLAGAMDNFRLFNRALSPEEMTDLYYTDAVPDGPRTARGVPIVYYGFIVDVQMVDAGSGYTNVPAVQFVGSGSGAEGVAVLSNGLVTAINILNPGFGYTNVTTVVIGPPYTYQPVLGIAPMSDLIFTNLASGNSYQLQQLLAGSWTNLPVVFVATNFNYSQLVPGTAGPGNYRLALAPVPTTAAAMAQVVDGFVVNISVSNGGTGYLADPAVAIVGGGGTGATAISQVSGGSVTNIVMTSAGIGYTNIPAVQIDPPPVPVVVPVVQPVMQINSSRLIPNDSYQLEFQSVLGADWSNVDEGLFSPPGDSDSRIVYLTNSAGFFRLQHLP